MAECRSSSTICSMRVDPIRVGVPRHVPEDIDAALAAYLLEALSPHLGPSLLQLERVGWTEKVDAENWCLVALAVASPLLALARHEMRNGEQRELVVEVYRTADIRELHASKNRVVARLLTDHAVREVELPQGTLAVEVLTAPR